MKKLIFFTALLYSATLLFSQTTVNYIPKFTSATGALGNSIMFQNSSKIGIGLTTPQSLLHIHNSATEECPPMIVVPMLGGVGQYLACSSSGLRLTNAITGTTTGDGLLIQTKNNDAEIHLKESGGTLKLYSGLSSNLALYLNSSSLTLGTDKFFVNSSGNVGIGTTMPRERIQIGEEFVFHDGGTKYFGRNCYYDATAGQSKKNLDGYSTIVSFPYEGSINFYTYANGNAGSTLVQTGNITMNNNGTVGIGTSNTFGYKLAVNGTIGAKEVTVETSSAWPDYVFGDNYKLLSLQETEDFIKANKHLPDVPSADKVETEGINLGEMNAILLQKIEELTLHIIDLEKRINQLEK